MRRNGRNGKAGDPSRVLGYVRVSTDEQASNGVSLDEQRRRVSTYADAEGLSLIDVESDEGISGSKTTNRPALQSTLKRLRKGEANGLIVTALDRLSRTTTDVLSLVARAEREGWTIHCVQDAIDAHSPDGEFLLTLRASLSQLERRKIGERTKRALGELRRQGRRVSGRPPFGYRHEAGQVVAVDEERTILREMLRLRGKGNGATLIARSLNERGLANPRSGRPWYPELIHGILRTAEKRERA